MGQPDKFGSPHNSVKLVRTATGGFCPYVRAVETGSLRKATIKNNKQSPKK